MCEEYKLRLFTIVTIDFSLTIAFHRIVLEKTGKHITARLEHFEEGELVTVSTTEPWIKSRLYRTYDRYV